MLLDPHCRAWGCLCVCRFGGGGGVEGGGQVSENILCIKWKRAAKAT